MWRIYFVLTAVLLAAGCGEHSVNAGAEPRTLPADSGSNANVQSYADVVAAELQRALARSGNRPALLLINRNGQPVSIAVPLK